MTVRVARITRALLAKGFREFENNHTHYVLYVDGASTHVRTKVSHGEREADDWLMAQMAKQLHLTKKLFLALV
jgi:hypothetical protein